MSVSYTHLDVYKRQMMDRRNFLRTASSFTLLTVGATTDASRTTGESIGKYLNLDKLPGMCAKEPMTADGIIRLSKIEVYPQYLDKYINYATEVGEISLRSEPGVLTMYAIGEKENPCNITILETYANHAAYEKHIASEPVSYTHLDVYKRQTLQRSQPLRVRVTSTN